MSSINNKPLVTKEELEGVLNEVSKEFRHIESHTIILLYVYVKKKLVEGQGSL